MKIAVNSRIYQNPNTGIPNYVKSIYSKLIEIDKMNDYIFFQTNNNKTIGKTKIIRLKETNLCNTLFDLFLINKLISKEINFKIFHGVSNILPFFKKKGIKYIVTVHDLSFLIFPKNHNKLFNLYYYYIVKISLNNADIIVADSLNTKKDIIRFYNIPKDKIKVVYLGVNNLFFEPKTKKRLIKDKYFFSITTHLERKNIFSILKVLAKNKTLHDFKYLIVGNIDKIQFKKLNMEIEKLNLKDRIILFGYASEEELINLYQNTEFFIYPSFYEGFGLPVIEAMACKCPVITSNNSSLIEITPNKDWLINPYDLKDIEKKMEMLLDLSKSERKKLIENNYKFAKKFTWDNTAKKMIKIFGGLKK